MARAQKHTYTVRWASFSLPLLLLATLCLCHAQGVNGGVQASAMPAPPSMSLRGGSDAAPAPQEAETAQAQAHMKEQLDYWNTLTKEQQDDLLSKMSPEERANAEAFVSGKPLTMTISAESLKAWQAMSKDEQDAQLATMSPEQQDAIKAAVDGSRETVDTSQAQ